MCLVSALWGHREARRHSWNPGAHGERGARGRRCKEVPGGCGGQTGGQGGGLCWQLDFTPGRVTLAKHLASLHFSFPICEGG